MKNSHYRNMIIIIGLFLLSSVAGLWSWNTLSDLFGFPQAQYKHILAAFLFLLLVKWSVSPGRGSMFHNAGRHHEQQAD